jgi:hypothetical protein
VRDVIAYINNPGSFREGLDLYRAYGDGTDLRLFEKALRQKYITSDIKERLIKRLQQLTSTLQTLPSSNNNGTPAPRIPSAPEPEIVSQLRQKGRKLKKEEAYLHAQLVTTAQHPDQSKLYELASAIMEIEYELDDVYGQIRRYEEKGELPIDNRRQLINEVVEKMKRRDSLRPRIYRIKKELKKDLDPIDRQKYEQELAEKEAELKQIEEELNL